MGCRQRAPFGAATRRRKRETEEMQSASPSRYSFVPGTAIGVLVGDIAFFFLAFHVAKKDQP